MGASLHTHRNSLGPSETIFFLIFFKVLLFCLLLRDKSGTIRGVFFRKKPSAAGLGPFGPLIKKTKTALKQGTYNLSDLKQDPYCRFVELGGSVSVSS